MHSHPHLVKGSAVEEYPKFPVGIIVRDKRSFWPGGVWGDPAKATAAKGRQIESLVADKVVELAKALESRLW
jgi:creatinine amidohydrolase